MLKKEYITNIPMLSEEWYQGRLARFTASEWHYWMGDKAITDGAKNYTYRKVGEELSGLPCRDEVDTKATEWGHKYESEAIIEFGKRKGIDFVVTQKLIRQPDSRFGCTPDFIIPIRESIDKLSYEVETGEVKCPPSYDKFIALALCKTPADVFKVNKIYGWQVIDQMYQCDALRGYLIIYNPLFKIGNMNIVEFRKKDLLPEFRLMNERKAMAEIFFIEVRDKMMQL